MKDKEYGFFMTRNYEVLKPSFNRKTIITSMLGVLATFTLADKVSAETVAPSNIEVVVQANETLSEILDINNSPLSLTQVASVNNIANPSIIKPGQRLKIDSCENGQIPVRPGSSISKLAESRNTTTQKFKDEYGLTTNEIYAGTCLVPVKAPVNKFTDVEIKLNDTLYGISRRFGVSVEQIIADNKITDRNKIMVGDILKIRVISDNTNSPKPQNLEKPKTPTTNPEKPKFLSEISEVLKLVEDFSFNDKEYQEFKKNIVDYRGEASKYPAYNMNIIKNTLPGSYIGEQPGVAFITLHYTDSYSNDIGNFLRSTNNSIGPEDSCCGPHYFIDQDGIVYWLISHDQRGRTVPPFDAATVSIEIEAKGNEPGEGEKEIINNPKQLKSSIYLLAYLSEIFKDDFAKFNFTDHIKGHAELYGRYMNEDDERRMQDLCIDLVNAGFKERNLIDCKNNGTTSGGRADFDEKYVIPIREKVRDILEELNDKSKRS